MTTNSKMVTVYIANVNGWWVCWGADSPRWQYLYYTKRDVKSRYYNEFIKPLHVKHKWVEVKYEDGCVEKYR